MKLNKITVFEHQSLRATGSRPEISQEQLEAFQRFYGEECPYFSLIHKGVKFCEYVGVIQVGSTLIEVLPKIDKNGAPDEWRSMLIGMLKSVKGFKIHAPSSSSLKLKPNSILDLYFEIFIAELEGLLRNGLLKQYRKKCSNLTALKGAIKFREQLKHNLIHRERFFVEYTTYDVHHKIHFILYKTLKLVKSINVNSRLASRLSSLLLNFPEMPDVPVSEETFSKLHISRKARPYLKALEISQLLLLSFHPDLTQGKNNVLALMFDMNLLWEEFVFNALRRQIKLSGIDLTITAQTSKYFWKPRQGRRSKVRPDIVINADRDSCVVLDTKWKDLKSYNPTVEDLRQMYVYHDYYQAKKVALLYPSIEDSSKAGRYLHHTNQCEMEKECSVISVAIVKDNIRMWEQQIFERFLAWFY